MYSDNFAVTLTITYLSISRFHCIDVCNPDALSTSSRYCFHGLGSSKRYLCKFLGSPISTGMTVLLFNWISYLNCLRVIKLCPSNIVCGPDLISSVLSSLSLLFKLLSSDTDKDKVQEGFELLKAQHVHRWLPPNHTIQSPKPRDIPLDLSFSSP